MVLSDFGMVEIHAAPPRVPHSQRGYSTYFRIMSGL
jgi:hypothetical protein